MTPVMRYEWGINGDEQQCELRNLAVEHLPPYAFDRVRGDGMAIRELVRGMTGRYVTFKPPWDEMPFPGKDIDFSKR